MHEHARAAVFRVGLKLTYSKRRETTVFIPWQSACALLVLVKIKFKYGQVKASWVR